jgi:hypothetical protein
MVWISLLALMMTACQGVNQEYLKNFEVVWQTVNDTFPDPTFGGVNWKAVHDRYRPLIGAAKNDEEFFLTLNRMLWELNASSSCRTGRPSSSRWPSRAWRMAQFLKGAA